MKVLRLQSETLIGRGNGVFGMIAQNEEACARVAFDAAIGPVTQIVLRQSIQASLPQAAGPAASFPSWCPLPATRKNLDPGPGCDAIVYEFRRVFCRGAEGL